MPLNETLNSLKALSEPHRKVDVAIAVDVGYFTKMVAERDGSVNECWFDPHGQQLRRIPSFTERVGAAVSLCQLVKPNSAGAVVWDDRGGCTARLDSGPAYTGSSAATAICIALIENLLAGEK